ncbi:MAG: hypothetical protein R6U40_06050 [Desulfobacterales bacterium]
MPQEIWAPIQNIGGETGWYFGKALWKLRGDLDRRIGGFGLRPDFRIVANSRSKKRDSIKKMIISLTFNLPQP